MLKTYFLLFTLMLFTFSFSQKKWGLQECVDYAYENTLSVKLSKINEKIQEKSVQISKNEWLPSVNGNFNNNLNFGPRLDPLTGSFFNKLSYSHNFGIDANMILWQKDKQKLDIKKSGINFEAQQWNTESLKNDIALQVVSYYLQIILNKELLSVSDRQKKIGADQLDKTEKLYKAGSIPFSNLATEQANFAANKQNYETALINIERAKFQLANLLQLPDYKIFDVHNISLPDNLTLGLENVNEIIEFAYQNQPAVKQALSNKEASELDVDIANVALWPTVTGTYSLGTSYNNGFEGGDKGLFNQWSNNYSQGIALGVNIPIFNKGNTKLRIEQAKINTEIYDNAIEQEKLKVKQNIQTAYFDANAAYQTYINAKEAEKAAGISYKYADLSYKAGKITIYEFNINRNNLAIAESQSIQAKFDFIFKLKVLDFYAGRPLGL